MALKSIYSTHKPVGGDQDLYLKLKDGDAVKMRIFSEPAITLYEEGQRPRYAWVIINHNTKKPQVFNAGVSIFSQIADLTEEWGDPTEFDIIVRRKGSGMQDTEYSVVPVKNLTAPTKDQEAEAEKIDLVGATKGKWLRVYEEDGQLPDPIKTREDTIHEVTDSPVKAEDLGDPIDPSEIPF